MNKPRGSRAGRLLSRQAVGLASVITVVGLTVAVVVWWTGRERSPRGLPIQVVLKESWQRLGDDRIALRRAKTNAARAGNEVQAAQLAFYADSAAAVGDVKLVVVTERFGGALVVRSQPAGSESLADLARRQSAEVAAQGGRLAARPFSLDDAAAWRFDFATGAPEFQQVKFWLDRDGRRYSVELTGSPDDVRSLTAAVRVS